MATDDDDAATLRERVRELEQTVAQQQDTIQQLLPSRRAVLAGGAGLVGGAALTGQASAQSAAGQVGTSSEPVDVEAAEVDADSVNTEEAIINGQPVRKVTSYQQSTTTTNTVTVEFDMTDLTPSEDYLIKFERVILADPGSVNVYIDNDTASGNANYKYFDQSGTAQSGQDQIQLVDTTAQFANVYGSVRYISNPSRPAVVSSLTGQLDRWVAYAQIGSYTTTPSDPTTQIEFVGGLSSGSTISLWRSI